MHTNVKKYKQTGKIPSFVHYCNNLATIVSAPESVWRLFQYPMNDMSHTIIRLAVHLPLEQMVYFHEGQENDALASAASADTTLTGFFKLNALDPQACDFVYHDIPMHYVFAAKKWKRRQRGENTIIARMYHVSPNDVECYYLRLLLLHVKGPLSFDDIKTVNGQQYDSYLSAARALNLLADDNEWINCLQEAALYQYPRQLRFLFAVICIYCTPSDPMALYTQFEKDLYEDLQRTFTHDESRNICLQDVDSILRTHGLNCGSIGLP